MRVRVRVRSCGLNHTRDDGASRLDTPAAIASGVVAQYARSVRREVSSTRPSSDGGTTSNALRRTERATASPAAARCERAPAGTRVATASPAAAASPESTTIDCIRPQKFLPPVFCAIALRAGPLAFVAGGALCWQAARGETVRHTRASAPTASK